MLRHVEVTAGFYLLLAAAYFLLDADIVFLTLPAALIHELAHLAALWLCGGRVERLRLTAFGAEMVIEDAAVLSYGREIVCAAAGPLSNILLAIAFSLMAGEDAFFSLGAGIHAVLAFFNLLPFSASDGGRILRAALCAWLGVDAGERIASGVGWICGGVLAALSLWVMLRTGGNGFLLLGTVGLLIPARKRYL